MDPTRRYARRAGGLQSGSAIGLKCALGEWSPAGRIWILGYRGCKGGIEQMSRLSNRGRLYALACDSVPSVAA